MPKPGDYDYKVQCRGRNGWFDFGKMEVSLFGDLDEIHICIKSKRHSELAPIIIYGPSKLVQSFVDHLVDALMAVRPAISSPQGWHHYNVTRKEIEDAPHPGI